MGTDQYHEFLIQCQRTGTGQEPSVAFQCKESAEIYQNSVMKRTVEITKDYPNILFPLASRAIIGTLM